MGKRLALLTIRLFVSVNLLYAAIFLKFAGVPDSVALFTLMSQAGRTVRRKCIGRIVNSILNTPNLVIRSAT